MCPRAPNPLQKAHRWQTPNTVTPVWNCTAPWYVAVGVFAIIGQPSEKVALVPHKSEAVSDPRAGGRAGPGCSGFQLLPQPATSLSHTRATSSVTIPFRDQFIATTWECNSLTWSSYRLLLYFPNSSMPPKTRIRVPSQTKPWAAHPGGISPLTAGRNHCFETGRMGRLLSRSSKLSLPFNI